MKKTAILGEMELDVTGKYKYLGYIMNNKGNLKHHINMIKGKTEAAYQKILTTAGIYHQNRTQAEKIGLDKTILTANKQTSKK